MLTIEGNPTALEAAANRLLGVGPVYMVNLVRYRPGYEKTAAPHRRAALADWKFMITTQPELPR